MKLFLEFVRAVGEVTFMVMAASAIAAEREDIFVRAHFRRHAHHYR